MRNKTTASLLTGGGLFDIGAMAAGYSHLWGIEIDPDIAGIARRNGLNVIIGDVATFDYASLERPYHLHASPECTRASVSSQASECETDILIADGIIRAIEILQPTTFTLENVWPYRNFKSLTNILACLSRLGYAVDFWHLNAADYGVPQTRRRLILVARRDRQPQRPRPTHAKPGDSQQLSFVDALPVWNNWYRAIEDLIPTLPESQFADWQLARLPENMTEFLINSDGNCNFAEAYPGRGCLDVDSPAHTVSTISNGVLPKAFLLGRGQRSAPQPAHRPADTITGSDNQTGIRAFLMRSDNASQELCYQIRTDTVPAHTVVNSHKSGYPRAFIMDCQNNNGSEGLTIRRNSEPIFTITANRNKQTIRAWLSQGRVVSMTPRALARLQSIPDDYELPDSNGLACKIIGNAVPPLEARRIMETL